MNDTDQAEYELAKSIKPIWVLIVTGLVIAFFANGYSVGKHSSERTVKANDVIWTSHQPIIFMTNGTDTALWRITFIE